MQVPRRQPCGFYTETEYRGNSPDAACQSRTRPEAAGIRHQAPVISSERAFLQILQVVLRLLGLLQVLLLLVLLLMLLLVVKLLLILQL